jgi:tetratricopeptide (TPR) repeat protein
MNTDQPGYCNERTSSALTGVHLWKISVPVHIFWMLLLTAAVAFGQSSPPDPNLLAAESYIRRQNFAKALEALDLVFKVNPKPPAGAYLMLASCQFNLGAKEKAADALERGVTAYPSAAGLAQEYVALLPTALSKETVRARLEERLKRQPGHPIYTKALARLAIEQDPAGAENTLAETARLLPRDPEAHFLYGQWACLNNRHELCVIELKKSLLLAPPNEQARMQIYTLTAMAEEELGRTAAAEASFRRALAANRKLAEQSPHATQRFVEFLAQRNRDQEAQPLVDEILKYAPNFGPAHFERAKWLARQRRLDDALAAGQRALENLNGQTEALRAVHAFMAKTFFAAGRPDEAKVHEDWIQAQARP